MERTKWPKYRMVILGVFGLSSFIVGMSGLVSGTLLPLIVEDIHLTPMQSGLLGATSSLVTVANTSFANLGADGLMKFI